MNRSFVAFSLSLTIIVPASFVLRKPASAQDRASGTVWALLVGINNYESADIGGLSYAVADVTAFRDLLKSPSLGNVPKENVVLMTDGAPGRWRPVNTSVFYQLDVLANRVRPEDTFIFYFSGHGMNREGHNYLLSCNADASTIEGLELSSIPLEKLKAKMEKIAARRMFFIIDACRNDPTKGRGTVDNPLTEEFVRGIHVIPRSGAEGEPTGVATLYACSVGERAYEWPERGHGVFSYYLLEGLKGKAAGASGEVTATDVADYVQKHVAAWTQENPNAAPKKQTPWLDQSGAARLVLAKVRPPKTPGEVIENPEVVGAPNVATLRITGAPAGAIVHIDGKDMGILPLDAEVDIGGETQKTVTVTVQKDGFKTMIYRIKLVQGKIVLYKVALPEVSAPASLPQSTHADHPAGIEFVRSWKPVAPIPAPRHVHAAVAYEGMIYVAGGSVGSASSVRDLATVEAFDPRTGQWSARAPMPTARSDFDMVALGKYIYAVGGRSGPNGRVRLLNSLERYAPSADEWTVLPPMPTARNAAAVAVLDQKVYVIGGNVVGGNFNGYTKVVEVYDPVINQWDRVADLPFAVAAINATTVDDSIYVFGDQPLWRGQVFQYTPRTDLWRVIQSVNAPRMAHAAVATVGRKIYVFGGIVPEATILSTTYEFDPITHTFRRGPNMQFPRWEFAWAAIENTLYAFGGLTTNQVVTNTVEQLVLSLP